MGKIKEKKTDNEFQLTALYGIESASTTKALTICKSQPLLALPKTNMTLTELKIFDIYLGRINPKDPNITKVVFTKSELCKVLGVSQIRNEDLKRCLKTLMSSIVEIKSINRSGKAESMFISLLSVARITYDDSHFGNVATVELKCSEEAKKYIYNIDAVGYLRMNLANVLSFEGRNPYALYQYLNQNRFRGCWEVGVDELKGYLGIPGKYDTFKDFERRVLIPCKAEIEAKTGMKFLYDKIKVGNRIQKVEFTIIREPKAIDKKPSEVPAHAYYDEDEDEWTVPFN